MSNRLSCIYTKTGDSGETHLANGKPIDKNDIQIHVIGDIDELNSLCGLLLATTTDTDIAHCILTIQNTLFDIGGELALPESEVISASYVQELEHLIDSYNKALPELKEFILPGGCLAAATCHLARSVCRRAERHLVEMYKTQSINPELLRYINRLSDLLFVLARYLNKIQGEQELFWQSERLKRLES